MSIGDEVKYLIHLAIRNGKYSCTYIYIDIYLSVRDYVPLHQWIYQIRISAANHQGEHLVSPALGSCRWASNSRMLCDMQGIQSREVPVAQVYTC